MPHELRYGQKMSKWLNAMYPDASEALHLAVRAQHIARWRVPRSSYPMDRTGYLRWRSDLARFHTSTAADILRAVGYDDALIERVESLIRKERIKTDADAQAVEDTACLVFLESEYAEFSGKHADEKVIEILRRTWKKMSPIGRAFAMKLPLAGRAKELIVRALS